MHIKKLGNCSLISVWGEGIVGGSLWVAVGFILDRVVWVVTEGPEEIQLRRAGKKPTSQRWWWWGDRWQLKLQEAPKRGSEETFQQARGKWG